MSKILLLLLVFGAITTIGFGNAFAASDYFLKLDGVEGESSDNKHKGEIEILSWSWGATNTGSMGQGGGGAGKASFQDFSFVHQIDKSSPLLFQSMATGEHFKQAVITVRKAGGEQQEYLRFTFTDVMVTSMGASGNSSDPAPTEQISFNYSKIEFEYIPYDENGRAAAPVKAGYDLALNKKV